VIGPEAARSMGYRVDWQSDAVPGTSGSLRSMSVQGDSIFAIDDQNFLTRMRRDDGQRLWRLPVAEPVSELQGVSYVPEIGRVFLTMGGTLLVLDADSGSPVGRHRLDKTASTAPLRCGPYLIYGARNGQLVWYLYEIGFAWRSAQVARTIDLAPVPVGDAVVAAGADGTIVVLQAVSAAPIWTKKLLDTVVAPPAAGRDAVYIAGMDQYLYAIEVHSGRTLWARLTTSPLIDPPVVVGDSVYQQVPGEGLTCFDALSHDAPGGTVRWVSPGCSGTVVTQRGPRLLAWDERARRMSVVDAARGSLVQQTDMKQVAHLFASGPRDAELFVAAADGRLVRVVPRD
jgi:outer membrane protein assembly factor BamB